MNANSSRCVAICSLVLVALGVPLAAHAAVLISGTVTPNGNGTFTYAYTVDNTAGLFPVIGWSLDFDFGPADRDWDPADVGFGGEVAVPANWIADDGVPVIGPLAQDFLSPRISSDLPVGGVLGGFSFVSALAPGSVRVFTFGPARESASGFTTGPVIPEPVGAATLVALLGGAYGVWRRSRRDTP